MTDFLSNESANEHIHFWENIFSSRSWGRYPPEDLVRFIFRNFSSDVDQKKILEVGCGPGANLWFLHREGFQVYGIDGSPSAILIAQERIQKENFTLNTNLPVLRVGNFSALPWDSGLFDAVIDIFAIYANPISIIKSTINEIHRVLKSQGKFYTKLWGKRCSGYGDGVFIEEGTYTKILSGPCKNMGVAHFFDIAEIYEIFSAFHLINIETILKTDLTSSIQIEEFHCYFEKN